MVAIEGKRASAPDRLQLWGARVLAAVATNAGGYWEVPFGYTGIITAYLGAAGTGNWRVAEIT